MILSLAEEASEETGGDRGTEQPGSAENEGI